MLARDELLRRSSALLPVIKERAAETEELRQIPPATIRNLSEAGLLRIVNPPRYGGYGHDFDLLFDTVVELGRGCGSTAWCHSVWTNHNWMVGHWPERFQDEYFGPGPDTLSSSGFAPTGQLAPVEGGFRLTGKWEFSSGADAATWAMLGAMSPDGPLFAMVPRHDYEVLDTWFASGLKGTGSNDIRVEDKFVPTYRTIRFDVPVLGSPGWSLHGLPSYRAPMMNVNAFAIACPILGMAQGAVDTFTESAQTAGRQGRSVDSVAVQTRLAAAAVEADAARVFGRHTLATILERGGRGDFPSHLEQARYRRDCSFAARLALQAVTRLFEGGGAHSVYTTSALQRFFRDAHAASHHAALGWEPLAERYGRIALQH